jgi:hypothetical protein
MFHMKDVKKKHIWHPAYISHKSVIIIIQQKELLRCQLNITF